MARRRTLTFEPQNTEGQRYEHELQTNNAGNGSPNTTEQFDGTACREIAPGNEAFIGVEASIGGSNIAYTRSAIRLQKASAASVSPSANLGLIGNEYGSYVRVHTNGEIVLRNPAKEVNAKETGFKPEAGRYYLYDLKVNTPAAGKGKIGLKIYSATGTTLYESGDVEVENASSAPFFWWAGRDNETDNVVTVFLSHFVLNDSEGANQNSYCGFAKTCALFPVSDKQRSTNWLDGNGGTSNLFESVNNRPPKGISGNTNGTKIKNAASTTSETYQANLQSYIEAGVGASDTIKLVHGLMRIANSTSTGRSLGLKGISNPEVAEITANTAGTVGTDNGFSASGWNTRVTEVKYSPTVTLSEQPVLQVRKNAASTNTVQVDWMALIVEYLPAEESETVYTETAEGTIGLEGSVAASLEALEAIGGTLGVNGIGSNELDSSDAVEGSVTVEGTLDHALEATEAQNGSLAPTGDAEGELDCTDAAGGSLSIQGTAADLLEFIEVTTGEVVFSGSLEDALEYMENVTGAVEVTGTGTAVSEFIEAVTGNEPMIGIKEEVYEVEEEEHDRPPYMLIPLGDYKRIIEEPDEETLSLWQKFLELFK